MTNIGAISYLTGGVSFALLAVMLASYWRGRFGSLLLLAVGITIAWCLILAINAMVGPLPQLIILLAELARDTFWLFFLVSLILVRKDAGFATRLRLCVHILWVSLLTVAIGTQAFGSNLITNQAAVFGFFLMSLTGLVVTEQVYRNTLADERWSVKFLCLALAGLFTFDLIFYSKAIMFRGLDMELWNARGFVTALVAPLIGLSASRSAQ
ncbi:MAG: hypothetical protein KJO35_02155, partial [Gammaproteobacteria bacterium]|nr:hypothetical protein [Gammaproteobacteria bacterium]